jgi:hypothetical protein
VTETTKPTSNFATIPTSAATAQATTGAFTAKARSAAPTQAHTLLKASDYFSSKAEGNTFINHKPNVVTSTNPAQVS